MVVVVRENKNYLVTWLLGEFSTHTTRCLHPRIVKLKLGSCYASQAPAGVSHVRGSDKFLLIHKCSHTPASECGQATGRPGVRQSFAPPCHASGGTSDFCVDV